MKIRLFAKKFIIDPLSGLYYVEVKNNELKLYYGTIPYKINSFTKEEVFTLGKHLFSGYQVIKYENGYKIGCCFVTHKQLQEIREEFNYKNIF